MVERISIGAHNLEEPEQMGLLLELPTRRKPVGKDQRDTIAPLRLAQQTGRQMPRSRCKHRLPSVDPIVSIRVEDDYMARCLLCGTTGPIRSNEEAARGVLLELLIHDKE